MADKDETPKAAVPTLEDMQQWARVMARAQQLMMDYMADQMTDATSKAPAGATGFQLPVMPMDPAEIAKAQVDMWNQGLAFWQQAFGGVPDPAALKERADKDRRFASVGWQQHPLFDMLRQSYLFVSERLLGSLDAMEGLDDKTREKLRFTTKAFVDAMSPSNLALTNPEVIERALETRGESLLKGLEHLLRDLRKGQLTHTDPDAFEVGRNIAITPGKVVKQTPLYQLIQYSPATEQVFETPLVIFPPWINRFYILDLNPKKSFIRWAVEQGLTVFVVSWKSADETMAHLSMDDYVLAEVDAIDTVRDLLGMPSVHAVGYCVAGTKLAAALALLDARGEAGKVATATFFTAQVDFSEAGDLLQFTTDEQLELVRQLSSGKGYLDGRYMAAAFNLLRGQDLVWNYVVHHYLMGEDYPQFDLLHWNGDTTNLPAEWHLDYLKRLYRENRLVEPGAITIDGTPIDLTRVNTPTYVQSGREDHIAPPKSVWKITHHFKGPLRFVLAGSGHIAGVVNPPDAQKYQYWVNEAKVDSFEEFIAGATEIKGSWWPDWIKWIESQSGTKIPATGARIPGEGKLKALEDAPGSYVRAR